MIDAPAPQDYLPPMTPKHVPFTREFIESVAAEYPTPFYIYDEAAIRETARDFLAAFNWAPGGFRNFFAVKALPNPAIMRIVAEEGMGYDCSSMAELALAEYSRRPATMIFLTSNNTPLAEFAKAKELGAIINLDDYSHIDYLHEGDRACPSASAALQPGSLKEGNVIIGQAGGGEVRVHPRADHRRVPACAELGAKEFGLHTMVASNELNPDYFIETAALLFELAVEIKEKTGVRITLLNLGGGNRHSLPAGAGAVDLHYVSRGIRELYDRPSSPAGLAPHADRYGERPMRDRPARLPRRACPPHQGHVQEVRRARRDDGRT